jgi:periplasmic protein TonB
MKYFLATLLFIISCSKCYSQIWGDSTFKTRPLFYSVEEAPKFPGGSSGYYRFLAENLKMPDNKFSRTSYKQVIVRIIIDTAGKVVFGEIEKGLNESYNVAALNLTKLLPVWSAARQNKHAVAVSVSLPILFVD